jgi:hypothetical protein
MRALGDWARARGLRLRLAARSCGTSGAGAWRSAVGARGAGACVAGAGAGAGAPGLAAPSSAPISAQPRASTAPTQAGPTTHPPTRSDPFAPQQALLLVQIHSLCQEHITALQQERAALCRELEALLPGAGRAPGAGLRAEWLAAFVPERGAPAAAGQPCPGQGAEAAAAGVVDGAAGSLAATRVQEIADEIEATTRCERSCMLICWQVGPFLGVPPSRAQADQLVRQQGPFVSTPPARTPRPTHRPTPPDSRAVRPPGYASRLHARSVGQGRLGARASGRDAQRAAPSLPCVRGPGPGSPWPHSPYGTAPLLTPTPAPTPHPHSAPHQFISHCWPYPAHETQCARILEHALKFTPDAFADRVDF